MYVSHWMRLLIATSTITHTALYAQAADFATELSVFKGQEVTVSNSAGSFRSTLEDVGKDYIKIGYEVPQADKTIVYFTNYYNLNAIDQVTVRKYNMRSNVTIHIP